jgi:hypothetical protein
VKEFFFIVSLSISNAPGIMEKMEILLSFVDHKSAIAHFHQAAFPRQNICRSNAARSPGGWGKK